MKERKLVIELGYTPRNLRDLMKGYGLKNGDIEQILEVTIRTVSNWRSSSSRVSMSHTQWEILLATLIDSPRFLIKKENAVTRYIIDTIYS